MLDPGLLDPFGVLDPGLLDPFGVLDPGVQDPFGVLDPGVLDPFGVLDPGLLDPFGGYRLTSWLLTVTTALRRSAHTDWEITLVSPRRCHHFSLVRMPRIAAGVASSISGVSSANNHR